MKPLSIKFPALVLVVMACAALLGGSLLAATSMPAESGALTTGSRAPYVHLINLYDRDGKIIDFKTNTNPYSPTTTCGKCHSMESIAHGWHFNAADPAAAKQAGRPGEPWILTDAATGTQLPVSDRGWPGTFTAKNAGLTSWQFTKTFGARTAGGGLGDQLSDTNPDPKARWKISGKLEVDCLICHSSDHTYNVVERAKQIEQENFQWAATVGAGLGEVKGSASKLPDTFDPDVDLENTDVPVLTYNKSRADSQNRVHFNVTRQPPAESCYACHSTQLVGSDAPPSFQHDKDVHMARGFTCTDCHRDAIDHMISRGYPGEDQYNPTPKVSTLSCEGCHLGNADAGDAMLARGGRMGAPHPLHKGLPPIHFEKLSCTACHSGEYPDATTHLAQTSMAHQLGMPSEFRNEQTLPHIVEPLFIKDTNGKIAPHRGFWPAYWGRLNKDNSVTPLPPSVVSLALGDILPKSAPETYVPLNDQDKIRVALNKLAVADSSTSKPVYLGAGQHVHIAGGKMFRLEFGAESQSQNFRGLPPPIVLTSTVHPAAALVTWPIAHDVRPAAQAIGAKSCTECHAADSPFYNSMTANAAWPQAQGPVPTVAAQAMFELRGEDPFEIKTWDMAFRTRSWFKLIAISSAAIVAVILLVSACRGVGQLLTIIAGRRGVSTASQRPGASATELRADAQLPPEDGPHA